MLVDSGGVLTTNVFAAFAGFCDREGLDPQHVGLTFRQDAAARSLLFELELGRLDEREFARGFAVALGLGEDRAEGLIEDLWADISPDEAMIEAVARFREAGVRTGLISNSWGTALKYESDLIDRLFDTSVISQLVGIRKQVAEMHELDAARME